MSVKLLGRYTDWRGTSYLQQTWSLWQLGALHHWCWETITLAGSTRQWDKNREYFAAKFDIWPPVWPWHWPSIKKITPEMDCPPSTTQKKRYYMTIYVIRMNSWKMFHIEDGGGRHLEFREMLNVTQVATKLIWLSLPCRTHFHEKSLQ